MLKQRNQQHYTASDIDHEEIVKKMRELGYEKLYNLKPKPHTPMSKLEWIFRCFIHRVKRKFETFVSWFSGCDEE